MNIAKKSLLALSIMTMVPIHQSQASAPESLKDAAKLSTFLSVCSSLGYYFFHSPVDRKSGAPIENLLKGKWDNVIDDFFSWNNITNFGDIIPGQASQNDIGGFGVYSLCERNMTKICKYVGATAAMYSLLYGKLNINAEELLNTLFNPYRTIPGKL